MQMLSSNMNVLLALFMQADIASDTGSRAFAADDASVSHRSGRASFFILIIPSERVTACHHLKPQFNLKLGQQKSAQTQTRDWADELSEIEFYKRSYVSIRDTYIQT
ncbi:hypothetical protein [Caulobacter sp. BK020]|uniref:hypothetical protein n=1 Tax=Caulobacter sp. BK020 TaxID=2512117 RepID=UPI001052E98F|nr:hypothetical protein [Caulobacter sp. BK020]